MALLDQVLRFIAERHHVTFQVLADAFPEHFADGDRDLTLEGENPNIVLWPYCSADGIAAIHEGFRSQRLYWNGTVAWAYFADGMRESPLQVAEHAEHTERRWFPVILLTETTSMA